MGRKLDLVDYVDEAEKEGDCHALTPDCVLCETHVDDAHEGNETRDAFGHLGVFIQVTDAFSFQLEVCFCIENIMLVVHLSKLEMC